MQEARQKIDNNFYQHCWKLTSQIAGMQVFFTDNLSIADCNLSCDTFNIIYIRKTENLTLAELQNAKAHFENKNLAYTIWTDEKQLTKAIRELLQKAGLHITNREPGMLLHLPSYTPKYQDAFTHIKKVTTVEEVLHYAQIVAHNWHPPDENLIAYYTKASPAILQSIARVTMYVYYILGKPVAAIELFISDEDTAGIFNLSTLEEYRGQGIGSALFTYALNEAKRQGCSYAVLQASEDGIDIYKRIGFSIETHFCELHH